MRIALYAALCLLISTRLLAQAPVAAFTASTTSGCAPLAITFTDQSTGGVQFWNWDFGNNTLSNLQNPTIAYSAPGVYTVKLVVRNANGPAQVIKTNYITVNPSPTATFTTNSQLGCSPSTFQFTDHSFDAAGSIVKWAWTFSDGTTSTAKNPVKQFTTVGFYDVSLAVTSSTGCMAGTGANRYIRIVPGVKADFTDTLPVTCRPPFAVKFVNQTSGPGTLTYNWDFGNSTSSTQTNPPATYSAAGTYTVKLVAQSDYGCQNTVQKTITLNTSTPSFTSTGVCINGPVSFQNTSAPAPASVLWRFGDGDSSKQQNPVKTYALPGTYLVKLISNYPNCTDSVTQSVKVNDKPVVNFTGSPIRTCKPNLTTNFQDLSPDAVSWQWDFGDGGTSTVKSPSHTYTSKGVFNVTLTITDSKGCQNSITSPALVQVTDPVAAVGNVPGGGCAPYNFTPISSSTSAEGIASYNWDFGDGGTSNLPVPTHQYITTGNYTLTLTVTSIDGCTNTVTIPNAVKVGAHATVDFSKNLSPVCRSSTVTFTDLTNPAGLPLIWNFGDGVDTATAPNPSHKYSDTGSYTVTLITYNNGCLDTLAKPAFIKVLGPVARFNYTVDCTTKTLVNFRDSSVVYPLPAPVPTYKWSFGDPGGNTASGTPLTTTSFNYPYPGPSLTGYQVQLVVDDGTCSDTATRTIELIDAVPDFIQSKDSVCRNEDVLFISQNSRAYAKAYDWYVNGVKAGGSNNNNMFTGNFSTTGNYTIGLQLTDINDCVSGIVTKTLVVTGPQAGFIIANNGGCKNSPVQFTDQSVSTSIIDKWTWNFGDGSAVSNLINPIHQYADTGLYNVSLTVHDTRGCTDTRIAADTITKPLAGFKADATLFCPGGPLQFTDTSVGKRISAWSWYFGDGGTATTQNPVHAYSGGDSVYSVKLVVHDAYGCSDSITRPNYITIKKAKPAFGVKDSSTICPPLETSFFFQGKDYESFFWDFGDGGSSTLQNPTHFFNSYGHDTVKLFLVGYGGCLDSASSVVNIYNPYLLTTVNYPPPYTACNEINVDFTFTTPPSTHSYFYFGDGAIDSSQAKTLQHFYNSPAFYAPFVEVRDGQGCIADIGGPSTIRVLGAVPIFGMDKKKFCDAGDVNFTNFTVNNDPVVSEVWDYGDGNTTTVVIPADVVHTNTSHTYTQPGLYVTSLTATTVAGCTKTLTDTVRVLRTPDPSIQTSDPVCVNNNLNFEGLLAVPDTAISWNWDFGNGQTSKQQQGSVVYNKAGTFTVHASAANSLGCMDTTSKTVLVNPLPTITVTGDTTLLVGLGITIPVIYSPNAVSYNWAPATHLSCTDCATPYADPKFTTTYTVVVTDENNCSSSRQITLITLCNNKNFFIPNTFSPNKDGSNDLFYPRGTGIDRIQAMRIFSRWGELVFEKRFFPANDPGSGWDGTYKGKPANADTYIYMIDIICENATIITYKGNVTLIR